MRDDLLGAGPRTVEELRSIAGRLRLKYQRQINWKIQRAMQKEQQQKQREDLTPVAAVAPPPPQIKDVTDKASNMAGDLFAKMKNPGFPGIKKPGFPAFNQRQDSSNPSESPSTIESLPSEPAATLVDLPPPPTPATVPAVANPAPSSNNSNLSGEWAGTDIAPATDLISNFSIGDDDDDDEDEFL